MESHHTCWFVCLPLRIEINSKEHSTRDEDGKNHNVKGEGERRERRHERGDDDPGTVELRGRVKLGKIE